MPRQLWLADVLRAAGLTVVEVSGWRDRGDADYHPQGVIIHETQGSWTSTDAGEIRVLINGREGLAGPIAQAYLSKTGTWHVVTSGQSNHARVGWGGPFEGIGNDGLMGIEAQHGSGEPWTDVQYRSYVRGVAAILAHTGWPPPVGHKEHQPGGKTDPGFDMDQFRADVAAVMRGAKLMILVRLKGDPTGKVWIADGITRRWVESQTELTAIKAAAKLGDIVLGNGGNYRDVTSLAPYGRDVAELGATAEVDLDALAAKLAGLVPSVEQFAAAVGARQAAADRASASVLDGEAAAP